MPMDLIQPAEPEARRKALWVVALASIFGSSAILAFEYLRNDFTNWLDGNIGALAQNPVAGALVAVVFVFPVVLIGLYLLRIGYRMIRFQRFPPPNYAVIRDTRVLTGLQAIRRGRIIRMLGIALLLVSMAIPWFIVNILRLFGP